MDGFRINWRLMGVLTVATLVFASLYLPQRVEEMRTGYWAVEHFLAYFLATFVVFMGWRRPLAVGATLVFLGVLLEVLQCLNPAHSPNPLAAAEQCRWSVGGSPLCRSLHPSPTKSPPPRKSALAPVKLTFEVLLRSIVLSCCVVPISHSNVQLHIVISHA